MGEEDTSMIVDPSYRGICANMKAAALPDEDPGSFSLTPFEFEESSEILWSDTRKVFFHACKANRFSDDYLMLCSQLERNIRHLGTVCITKTVLEKNNKIFSGISGLNVRELVSMVSYHLRKAHAALEGIYRDNNVLGLSYLNWEFRWVGLGNRLKATEAKINMIREGKINVDSILRQAETFGNDAAAYDQDRTEDIAANPEAFPILGTVARMMRIEEKAKAEEAERVRREREQKIREAEKLERRADRWYGSFQPARALGPDKNILAMFSRERARKLRDEVEAELAEDDICSGEEISEESRAAADGKDGTDSARSETVSEAEARRRLIEDALERKDQAAVLAIPKEDSDALLIRWKQYMERKIRSFLASGTGPPPDTRKALRGKRKKKK